MDYCRAVEAANRQLNEVSRRGPDTVHYLRKSKKGKPQSQLRFRAQPKVGRNTDSSANNQMSMRDCKNCGWRHECKEEECPAFERTTSAMSANNKYSLLTKPPPAVTCSRAS